MLPLGDRTGVPPNVSYGCCPTSKGRLSVGRQQVKKAVSTLGRGIEHDQPENVRPPLCDGDGQVSDAQVVSGVCLHLSHHEVQL